jgi:hypothetical protein
MNASATCTPFRKLLQAFFTSITGTPVAPIRCETMWDVAGSMRS